MQHVRVFATCKELLPLLNAHSLLNVTPPPPPRQNLFSKELTFLISNVEIEIGRSIFA